MLLLIDNYDSFVYNLARYIEQLGQETMVVRNDAINVAEIGSLRPTAIVISPGPCTPAEAGCSVDVVREYFSSIPILGVCLGHQAIAAALGGQVIRAAEPMHGRTSLVEHDGSPLFDQIPTPLTVCRYHSLIVERTSLPETLVGTAFTADGTMMALAARAQPVFGVQFHPEAILTGHGYRLLANFLAIAGCPSNADVDALSAAEMRTVRRQIPPAPRVPVTF